MNHFFRQSSQVGLMQLISRGLVLVTSMLLARLLGTTEYGAYANALAWLEIAVILAALGLPRVLIRDITAQRHHGNFAAAYQHMNRSFGYCALASLLVIGGGAAFATLHYSQSTVLYPLYLALLIVPLRVSLQLFQALLMGFREISKAQWPALLLAPGLTCVGIIILLALGRYTTASEVIGIQLAASIIALALMLLLAFPSYGRLAAYRSDERITLRYHGASSLLLTELITMGVYAAPVLTLSSMGKLQEAAWFAIALKVAELPMFIEQVINTTLTQRLAEPGLQSDKARFQQLFTQCARISGGAAIILGTALIGFGETILAYAFSEAFRPAYMPLVILCVGAMINGACGSVSVLLSMTHHERTLLFNCTMGGVLTLLLLAVLIPSYGTNGAAIAAAAGIILQNILNAVQVWRKCGLIPGMFTRLPSLKKLDK